MQCAPHMTALAHPYYHSDFFFDLVSQINRHGLSDCNGHALLRFPLTLRKIHFNFTIDQLQVGFKLSAFAGFKAF